VLANAITFVPTLAIWLKVTLSLERSIRNAVSLLELSVQLRSISLVDTAFAVRPVGAAGATGAGLVVALATFEYAESLFTVLAARTRK